MVKVVIFQICQFTTLNLEASPSLVNPHLWCHYIISTFPLSTEAVQVSASSYNT